MSSPVLETVTLVENGGLVKEIYAYGEDGAIPNAGDEVSGEPWRLQFLQLPPL